MRDLMQIEKGMSTNNDDPERGENSNDDDSKKGPHVSRSAFAAFIKKYGSQPIDAIYAVIVEGFPGFPGANAIASHHREKPGTLEERAKGLLDWQSAFAGSAGFVTGLGGYATILVSVPAAAIIQATTVAAIAALAGDDPLNPNVKMMVLAIIGFDSAAQPMKRGADAAAKSFAKKGIRAIPVRFIEKINSAAGSRLITKFGTKGAVNLSKSLPFVGGLVGGTFDFFVLRSVGEVAIKRFITGRELPHSSAE